MTVSQKAALSLLISVVLAAGFSVLAFTGFFNLIETQFYNPAITNSLGREVGRDANTIENFLDELRDRFSAALSADAVKRSFLPNQTAQDIFERTRVYGLLLESQKGIQSVRFVDAGGLRIHFSTSQGDVLGRSAEAISYRNYDETTPFVPYADLAVASGGNPKITMDQENERIIFSFPFYDSMEVYRGTAFYSVSIRAIADRLMAEGRIKIGENVSIVSSPPGIVSGLPNAFDEAAALVPVISSIWNEGILNLTGLDSGISAFSLALISSKTSQNLFVGRVTDESLFIFPQSMKMILLSAIFLTVFLSIFLAFNLQPDTITVVQNRLKNLQLSLIREYYERKGEMDWNHWYRELEQRREDVRIELKRGVKEKPALIEDIDSLIDKSWDEILTAIGGKRETRLAIDEDKLQIILNRMLQAAGNSPVVPGKGTVTDLMPLVNAGPAASGTDSSDVEEEVLEELAEEVEEAEAPEELDAAEGLDAPEELEDLEELEEFEELESFSGSGEAEESIDTAAMSSALQVSQKSDIPVVVELSGVDAGEAEELEELDDMEDLEAIGELEEPEELETAAPVSGPSDHENDVASKIEFETAGVPEDTDIELGADGEYVIVSPFSSMLSKFDDQSGFKADDDEVKTVKTSGHLEELYGDYSMSLVHKPFQSDVENEPQELPAAGLGIIKQKNGVNYVDKKVKAPDPKTSKALDPGLKNLVDSVIGKK